MINGSKLIVVTQNDHINFLYKQKIVKSLRGSIKEMFITYIKRDVSETLLKDVSENKKGTPIFFSVQRTQQV